MDTNWIYSFTATNPKLTQMITQQVTSGELSRSRPFVTSNIILAALSPIQISHFFSCKNMAFHPRRACAIIIVCNCFSLRRNPAFFAYLLVLPCVLLSSPHFGHFLVTSPKAPLRWFLVSLSLNTLLQACMLVISCDDESIFYFC